jgi:hypothetical protein
MAWKHTGDERIVEVIVEPRFEGDLIEMARLRPVWIIDWAFNRDDIDSAWKVGEALNLCEINRYPFSGASDRKAALLDMIGVFDDQYQAYSGLCVHGLAYDSEVREAIVAEGFSLIRMLPDGFCVALDQAVRNSLIGL